MKTDRRDFLKLSSLAGIGLTGGDFIRESVVPTVGVKKSEKISNQPFNMCGWAAPKMDRVRVGFIGLGNRGPDAVARMRLIDGVDIQALCDIRPEKVDAVKKSLEGSIHQPQVYTRDGNDWKKLCERPDVDLVYIATPWSLHTPMAVYAMTQGKHVCTEVPAAKTLEECWQLVETSQQTRKHCMILENCCYDFFELLTLNMVRQGLFGEILHGEGAYIHNLFEGNFSKTKYYDLWRLKENFRNGNLYPTHGLGPVAQTMNLNRGEKMDFLVSTSTNDFMMGAKAKDLAAIDPFYEPYADKTFRGNMNTTNIRTGKGYSIHLKHDVTSPNVYSRIYKISGTKGSVLRYPLPGKINFGGESWLSQEEFTEYENKYTPPYCQKIR